MGQFKREVQVVKFVSKGKGKGVDKSYYVNNEWAPNIADTMGSEWSDRVYVDLRDMPQDDYLTTVKRLSSAGVVVRGLPTKFTTDEQGKTVPCAWGPDKTYFLSFATAGTKSKLLICVAGKGVGKVLFPKPLDAIRCGALYTPTPCDILDIEGVVEIAAKDDTRWFLGDGQFAFPADMMGFERMWKRPITNKEGQIVRWENMAAQVRAFIPEYGALFKGVGIPVKGLDHIVAHPGCFKSNGKIPSTFDLTFKMGLVRIPEVFTMTVGYQVTQNWPWFVWAEMLKHMPSIIIRNHERMSDPLTFASSFVSPLRGSQGGVLNHGIFQRGAQFCVKTGNVDLLGSPFFVSTLKDAAAVLNTADCVSGGVEAIGLVATCNQSLDDFVVVMNPMDFFIDEKLDEEYLLDHLAEHGHKFVMGRYPSEDLDCQIAVTVYFDFNQPSGTFAMNARTGNKAGFDFDGDAGFFIYACQTPWTEILFYHLIDTQTLDSDNGRQYGTPPDSTEQQIVNIMMVNIGEIANALSDLQILAGLSPELMPQIKNWQALMKIELRKGVDSAKKAALPNKALIKECKSWISEMGVTEEDGRMRIVSNGTVLGWREQPHTYETETFCVEEGQYVTPWEIMSDRSPIGMNFHTMGQELVQIKYSHTFYGPHFQNWIPVIEGEGWDFAKDQLRQADEAMRAAALSSDPEAARSDFFVVWSKIWFDKLGESTEWKRSAISYLWTKTFHSERGKQTFLWTSMPEVIFEMLDEYGPELIQAEATVAGFILGRTFVNAFDADQKDLLLTENTVEMILNVGHKVDDSGHLRAGVQVDAETFHYFNERTPDMVNGEYVLQIKAVLKGGEFTGRFAFISYGVTKAEVAHLEDIDAALAA